MIVTNEDGRRFTVRVVFPGGRYGVLDQVVHRDEMDLGPLVEFYDLTYTERFGPRGQFVSRYYLSTLQERNWGGPLPLQGDVPVWTITASNLREAIAFALIPETGVDPAEVAHAGALVQVARDARKSRAFRGYG